MYFLALSAAEGAYEQCTHPMLRCWFLQRKEPGLLKKMLILEQGQGKYKMSLEHLLVPESKEVFKWQKEEGMSKGYRSQPGIVPSS